MAQQQLEIGATQVRNADRLIQADVISKVDRLRAESGRLARKAVSITAETNVKIAARELKRIMQQPDLPVDSADTLTTATSPRPLGLDLDRRILAEHAIANRMEMFEIELELLADAIRIAVQDNAVLPRLDVAARYALLGSGGTLGKSYDRLFGDGFDDWFVGLVAEVPLPLGRNQTAEARRGQAVLKQSQNRIVQERLRVIILQEVNDAVDRLEQNWLRVLAARQAVLASEQTYQAELRLFDQGQRDSTDVLFAADRLAAVQIDEINALADLEIAKVELAVATGTMLGFGQVQWAPRCE